jgi:alpha-amylase
MLAYPYGYPKIMSSYYFADFDQGPPDVPVHAKSGSVHCSDGLNWVCEHRWESIANMVNWRKSAADSPLTMFASDGNTISFCRGKQACLAINKQSISWEVALLTSMPSGYYCDIVQSDRSDCPYVFVDSEGIVKLTVPQMSVVAFHAGKRPELEFLQKSQILANTLSAAVGVAAAVSLMSSVIFLLLCAKSRRPSAVDTRPLL